MAYEELPLSIRTLIGMAREREPQLPSWDVVGRRAQLGPDASPEEIAAARLRAGVVRAPQIDPREGLSRWETEQMPIHPARAAQAAEHAGDDAFERQAFRLASGVRRPMVTGEETNWQDVARRGVEAAMPLYGGATHLAPENIPLRAVGAAADAATLFPRTAATGIRAAVRGGEAAARWAPGATEKAAQWLIPIEPGEVTLGVAGSRRLRRRPGGASGGGGEELPPPPIGSNMPPGEPLPIERSRPKAITANSLRNVPLDEAIAKARTEEHIIPSPSREGFVGAPANVKTREDLERMRAQFDQQVEAGLVGADWYPRAQGGIREIAGSRPERQSLLARELALTSAQADPDVNLGFALAAHNAYEAGKPASKVRTGQQAETYREARDAGEEIRLGKKTGVYGGHLDPTKEDPTTGTNDIWHARAFGYTGKGGKEFDRALTAQEHAFLDAETVLAVARANERRLGGRSDWTAGEIQAAPWVTGKGRGLEKKRGMTPEQGLAEASKTYPDYYPKYTAAGTYEATPGLGTGHRPDISGGDLPTREAFTRDPRTSWAGDDGRDILYDALGLYARPTLPSTGMYQMPGGPLEVNPANVARPMVSLTGPTGQRKLDAPSRAAMDIAEAVRAYGDVQNAGAWSMPISGNKAGSSTSLFVANRGPMSEPQMMSLKALGEKHGLGDIIDYGVGAGMTSFSDKGPPTAAELRRSIKQGLPTDIAQIVPGGDKAKRVQLDTGYVSMFEKSPERAEGKGRATKELFKRLNSKDFPSAVEKLDADPRIRDAFLARLNRDAASGAPVRADVQRARDIVVSDGFSGLWKAYRAGVALPAAALLFLAEQAPGQGE